MSIRVSPLDPQEARIVSIGEPTPQKAPNIAQAAPGSTGTTSPKALPTGQQESIVGQPDASQTPSDPGLLELARQTKLLREEAKALKAERAELQALRAQSQGMTAEQWKERFLADPASVGIKYQEMADKYLSQPPEEVQAQAAIKAELVELKAKMQANEQQVEAAKTAAYQNAKKQLLGDAQRLVSLKPQEYEAIAVEGAYDAVVELIEDTYKETGIFMGVEEAAKEVDNYLLERAKKYAGLKKLQPTMSSEDPSAVSPTSQSTKTPTQQQTLSHSMSQATAPLTQAQRRERAIAAFHSKK